jgi:hypothetical protein
MSRSPEYYQYIQSSEWREKSKACQRLTKNYCVLFPWLKSNHTHHLSYNNFKNEKPLIDLVPLSKVAHSIIHFSLFWKVKKVRLIINIVLRLLMIIWVILAVFRK